MYSWHLDSTGVLFLAFAWEAILVLGYVMAKKYPQLVWPARTASITWIIVHIFVFPHSMYLLRYFKKIESAQQKKNPPPPKPIHPNTKSLANNVALLQILDAY